MPIDLVTFITHNAFNFLNGGYTICKFTKHQLVMSKYSQYSSFSRIHIFLLKLSVADIYQHLVSYNPLLPIYLTHLITSWSL